MIRAAVPNQSSKLMSCLLSSYTSGQAAHRSPHTLSGSNFYLCQVGLCGPCFSSPPLTLNCVFTHAMPHTG
ncbi:hypothetical protein XELAEV_18001732mg [Xenopus laevis]|nr:hypothetical protein XELAEV_18001732mg [Xenopus laevis]